MQLITNHQEKSRTKIVDEGILLRSLTVNLSRDYLYTGMRPAEHQKSGNLEQAIFTDRGARRRSRLRELRGGSGGFSPQKILKNETRFPAIWGIFRARFRSIDILENTPKSHRKLPFLMMMEYLVIQDGTR